MDDFFVVVIVFIAIAIGAVWGVATLNYQGALIGCDRFSGATGLETKYIGTKWIGSCFVKVDDKWIESANYGMGFTQGK